MRDDVKKNRMIKPETSTKLVGLLLEGNGLCINWHTGIFKEDKFQGQTQQELGLGGACIISLRSDCSCYFDCYGEQEDLILLHQEL